MSEEQQAVLDESQENGAIETQSAENQDTTTQETQVDSATTDDAKPEVSNSEKRINKITAEKYSYKRQADALQEELERLKAGTPQNEAVTQPEGAPTLEQFDFDESKYQAALIRHEVDQGIQARMEAEQKAKTQREQVQLESAFNEKEIKYATDNPSYVEDVNNLPRFNPDTLSIIKGQENAPSLVHYLSKNPDEAHTIASLDPMSAGVRIGMVMTKLSATGKTEIKTSTAPEPVEPINTGGKLSDNMSPHAKGATFE